MGEKLFERHGKYTRVVPLFPAQFALVVRLAGSIPPELGNLSALRDSALMLIL